MSRSGWWLLASMLGMACSHPCRDLEAAAMVGDVEAMDRLVASGIEVSCHDVEAWQPIHYAARAGHTRAVLWLLDHGVDVESPGEIGRRPLYEAAKYDHATTVRALLERGADVDGRSSAGMTPLYVVAERHHAAMASLLLDAGADVNAASPAGVTPIGQAIRFGREEADTIETVRLLLERGAWTEVHEREGWVPLHVATDRGWVETTTALLDHGANPSALARGRLPRAEPGRHDAEITALLRARTIWDPVEITHAAAPTVSVTRGATVIASSGPRAAPIGTRCEVTMRPIEGVSHFPCQVEAHCGEGGLYGGPSSGFATCEEIDGHWRALDSMATPEDGDPAMMLDFGRHAFVADDGLLAPTGTSVQLRLDDDPPS